MTVNTNKKTDKKYNQLCYNVYDIPEHIVSM